MPVLIFFFIVLSPFFGEAKLFIDDPSLLKKLEGQGFSFSDLSLGETKALKNNQELYKKNKKYQFIVSSLEEDLSASKASDHSLSTTMATGHRLFDRQWLKASDAHFELVGLINRVDRIPFKKDSCGEIRLIYRLAYQKKKEKIYSRLPMTINAVFWPPKTTDCHQVTKIWDGFLKKLAKAPADVRPQHLGLDAKQLKSVEINLQAVRWPSTVRPAMGGYAEYFLRVFEPQGDTLFLKALENTPDVRKINSSPQLKTELLTWIAENLNDIDKGVTLLPDKFLSKKATSVALHGVHRLANAPFTQIFNEKDFKNISFKNKKTIRSAHGLLRRLNDLSCMGCHQGRTVAGFHFLGKDRGETDSVNAIFTAFSQHFLSDQQRRGLFFRKVASQKKPNSFRGFSVRTGHEPGTFGAHCGLGDPSFKEWTCDPGLTCKEVIKDKRVSRTGICEPENPIAGSSCQPGHIRHHNNPHQDRVHLLSSTSCGNGAICETARVGFPGGMCSKNCADIQSGEACGSIAILHGFNTCLARGKDLFTKCLSQNVRGAGLKSCSDHEACRDDFVCARTPKEKGACIPPYFLFQLRVDGHPKA